MEIKKIKMSPKRGGNSFISSYSVNIGSKEAKNCGLVGDIVPHVVIKIIDTDNKQIIIKEKQYTLTDDIINTVIDYAIKSNDLNDKMELSLPNTQDFGDFRTVEIADIPIPRIDTDNPYANALISLNQEFHEYLLTLPFETLTDLMTLMYIGRDNDANMTLSCMQRFIDYWEYLEDSGCFADSSEVIASQLMDKAPLDKYLKNGQRILFTDVQIDTTLANKNLDDYNGNGDWL